MPCILPEKNFIESESSEKLRRALRHQVRTNLADSFKNGDLVLFKRNESDRWMGPGSVIGWEHKQVLVKHGGTYVRVHPSRLTVYPEAYQVPSETISSEPIPPHNQDHGSSLVPDSILDESDTNDDPERPQASTDAEPPGTTTKSTRLPKPGQSINCRLRNDEDEERRKLKVISRAGKATGKNRYLMNVVLEHGEPFWLDFEHGVIDWQTDTEDEQTISPEENVMNVSSNEDLDIAKKKELQSWSENQVFTQVPDQGQPRISTRWVFTDKLSNGDNILKARLVARGFQDKDACNIRNDSPTCSKESLRIVLGIMASNSWTCKSMDIRTAFLQSKQLDRPVFLLPPKEANVPHGHIWKLSKCVYGLTDASRSWYLTLREELTRLGAIASKHDQAIFTWCFENRLQGIIATHVDDFCFGGSEIFQNQVIDNLRKVFKIKSEEVAEFQYVGLNIKKTEKNIKLGQDEYIKKLHHIPLQNNRTPEDKLSSAEVTQARQLIGQLNWLATQTRPDLSYDVSALSSILKLENVECIKQINRTVKKAKKEKCQIDIPDLGNPTSIQIVAYSDASFANLTDGGSQGGFIIFLLGNNNRYMPIAWQSKRVKRIVKSTLAAETLAMVDMAEACMFYRKLLLEILQLSDDPANVKITCRTDNSCLYDAVHSTTQILDKRLRIEMAILREMLDRKEITDISWVPADVQVADALTKKGVPSFKILGFISEPKESFV